MFDSTAEMGAPLIGRTVSAIYVSESRLTFDTDAGQVSYEVEGDCCSSSYFHDVVGVEHLLSNGPVTAFEEVDLQPGDPGYHDPNCEGSWTGPAACGGNHDAIAVYGYRLTTEHPKFGPVSTVIAFRNDSNGYYGGWMERVDGKVRPDQHRVTSDVLGPLDRAFGEVTS